MSPQKNYTLVCSGTGVCDYVKPYATKCDGAFGQAVSATDIVLG